MLVLDTMLLFYYSTRIQLINMRSEIIPFDLVLEDYSVSWWQNTTMDKKIVTKLGV
jgi:hypothetical protein